VNWAYNTKHTNNPDGNAHKNREETSNPRQLFEVKSTQENRQIKNSNNSSAAAHYMQHTISFSFKKGRSSWEAPFTLCKQTLTLLLVQLA
jgi:hypothetical protein